MADVEHYIDVKLTEDEFAAFRRTFEQLDTSYLNRWDRCLAIFKSALAHARGHNGKALADALDANADLKAQLEAAQGDLKQADGLAKLLDEEVGRQAARADEAEARVRQLRDDTDRLNGVVQKLTQVRSTRTICLVDSEKLTSEWFALVPVGEKVVSDDDDILEWVV